MKSPRQGHLLGPRLLGQKGSEEPWGITRTSWALSGGQSFGQHLRPPDSDSDPEKPQLMANPADGRAAAPLALVGQSIMVS